MNNLKENGIENRSFKMGKQTNRTRRINLKTRCK